MTVMDRRALVLGGGGVTGIAGETGLIAGLAGLGIDLAAAEVIAGIPAGSVAGADIASGREPEALYQAQLAPPAPGPAAWIGWDFIGRPTGRSYFRAGHTHVPRRPRFVRVSARMPRLGTKRPPVRSTLLRSPHHISCDVR